MNATQTTLAQPELFGFSRVEMVPQGGGEWRLKACKPVRWLTPFEFGQEVGLSSDSIYRYKDEGWISPEHIRRCGKTRLKIDAAAVPLFLARSTAEAERKAAARAERLGPTLAIHG